MIYFVGSYIIIKIFDANCIMTIYVNIINFMVINNESNHSDYSRFGCCITTNGSTTITPINVPITRQTLPQGPGLSDIIAGQTP
jgi:hypothetical protein